MMNDATEYRQRRERLIELVAQQHPQRQGVIVIYAAYEQSRYCFWQDSTWRYFVGLNEPGAVLLLQLDGTATIYLPTFTVNRAAWMSHVVEPNPATAARCGVDAMLPLGLPTAGYHTSMLFPQTAHEYVIADLLRLLGSEGRIFAPLSARTEAYELQRTIFERWTTFAPGLKDRSVDISAAIGALRRTKSVDEIQAIRSAASITAEAQKAAAAAMRDGVSEAVVEAALSATMIRHGARHAFPPIIASGVRGTILHYHDNNELLRDGELLVLDSGASVDGYAADISRTYPVSGKFTPRQRELYDIVLATQALVAESARPGLWLRNAEKPDQSLHHIAVNYLKRYGLDSHFSHGIGHFLGLDVHDVGDATQPLQEGDVITIEPGVYIRDEQIGIRIEDDFLIERDGTTCLSDSLPRSAEEIEALVGRESF